MQRWLWPIYFDTLKRYSDKKLWKITSFSLTRKMFDSDNFSKKCAQLAHVTYEEKPQLKINSFKNQKNGCFNAYSIIQSCLGYRCKLSIANLSWRVTCSYAYSPFNDIQCLCCWCIGSCESIMPTCKWRVTWNSICSPFNFKKIVPLIWENSPFNLRK